MMTSALFALAGALAASAMPTTYPIMSRQMAAGGPTDTQILQYALTLENLENNLYSNMLKKFSAQDFANAGYDAWVRNRYEEIATHEASHVSLLSGALGNASVAPCEYSFPYTDPVSFVGLATLIENVGVSAYAGAAQYISDKTYLTIAAVILSTEARHQSWMSSSVSKHEPWSSPYDTALGLDMVYTIASAFITSCPSTNAALPVKAFPALTLKSDYPIVAGCNVAFNFDGSSSTDTKYAVFYSGVGTAVVQLDQNNHATIPTALQGISYVVVSTASTAAAVTPDNIVAGPAILDFTFVSATPNPPFMG